MCRSLSRVARELALLAALAPAAAAGATAKLATGGLVDPAPAAEVYLRVVLNGEDTNLIAAFTETSGSRLSIAPKEFAELGFAVPEGGGPIALDGLTGLSYRYDRSAQVVRIEAV